MSIEELAADYFAWVEKEEQERKDFNLYLQSKNQSSIDWVELTFERYLKTKLDSPTNQSRKEL